jgi:dimethylaniline monooxygenase (N-oxide forming)
MSCLPLVCIVGAGSSGIAACKVLNQFGIPYDCFEASARVGGMWQFGNPHSSAAYRSLHINTSRRTMEYSDFPMPAGYPDFPHHELIQAYFEAYVDHFGFRERITFNTRIVRCERRADELWEVELGTGEKRLYDVLIVANGHHWDPLWPEPRFAGTFSGVQTHAHDYVDETEPVDCRGKNVVIVGMGNSAMDIACELGKKGNARKLFLAIRTPNHVIPKYLRGGKLLDAWSRHPAQPVGAAERILRRLIPPRAAARALEYWVTREIEKTVGPPEQYGLPRPEHGFFQAHPTISSEIHYRLGAGDIIPKPNLQELCGTRVRFVDGSIEECDVIIYATGYKISFPFLDPSLISTRSNDIALYKRMLDPRYLNLLFLALVQPLCAMMPIAEQQSTWMAKYLMGEYRLPSRRIMDRERLSVHERTKHGYIPSARHTIQINCQEYCDDLRAELKAGARRARRTGNLLPVPGRARALSASAQTPSPRPAALG